MPINNKGDELEQLNKSVKALNHRDELIKKYPLETLLTESEDEKLKQIFCKQLEIPVEILSSSQPLQESFKQFSQQYHRKLDEVDRAILKGYSLKDMHCQECHKKLGNILQSGNSIVEIQCPRCKTKNQIKV